MRSCRIVASTTYDPQRAESMTDIEIAKIIIPIVTFLLGSAFTLTLKVLEQRRSSLKGAAQEAARLTRDWYNQIHELILTPATAISSAPVNTAIYDYVHNRLILPELMLYLEVLKRRKRGSRLVAALESFLDEVTYPIRDYPEGRACAEILVASEATTASDDPPDAVIPVVKRLDGRDKDRLLQVLDAHVQRVTREAAIILV